MYRESGEKPMEENAKVLGEERHALLIETLKNAKNPIPGRMLGDMMNVSRQVIVGDITLLKAKGEQIIATNRGYIYLPQNESSKITKIIACRHTTEQTEEELNILVDHGVTVEDVHIEHAVYGDLRAAIMVSNRQEVKQFINNIKQSNDEFLLKLTECGMHLHTISASSSEHLQAAENALQDAGFLVESP